jgi:hypothetical protein
MPMMPIIAFSLVKPIVTECTDNIVQTDYCSAANVRSVNQSFIESLHQLLSLSNMRRTLGKKKELSAERREFKAEIHRFNGPTGRRGPTNVPSSNVMQNVYASGWISLEHGLELALSQSASTKMR